eukprot:jgi/Hompol1/1419/HPOL_005518-RA
MEAANATTIAGSIGMERFKDRWLVLGLIMAYTGEIGNWIALSLTSATLVTPLGIISVITNMFLAERYLGEHVTKKQRRGYLLALIGVLGILISAPKGDSTLGSTTEQVFNSLLSPSVVNGFSLMLIVQTMLIYRVFVDQTHTIILYLGVRPLSVLASLTRSAARHAPAPATLKPFAFAGDRACSRMLHSTPSALKTVQFMLADIGEGITECELIQ